MLTCHLWYAWFLSLRWTCGWMRRMAWCQINIYDLEIRNILKQFVAKYSEILYHQLSVSTLIIIIWICNNKNNLWFVLNGRISQKSVFVKLFAWCLPVDYFTEAEKPKLIKSQLKFNSCLAKLLHTIRMPKQIRTGVYDAFPCFIGIHSSDKWVACISMSS